MLVTAAMQLVVPQSARCLNAQNDGKFEVTMNLQVTGRSRTGTGSASNTFWEVSPLPSPGDVSVSPNNDDVRQAILKALDEMRAKEAQQDKEASDKGKPIPHFHLNDPAEWNFGPELIEDLKHQIEVDRPVFSALPTFFNQPTAEQVGISIPCPYKIKLSVPFTRMLHILIATAQAAKDGATVISVDKTIQEISQHFDLGNLTPDEQRIPVVIKYTAADDSPPNGASLPAASAEYKLMGVAAYAFKQARSAGLVLSKPLPSGNIAAGTENIIKAEYGLANPKVQGWSPPDTHIKIEDKNAGLWGIEISQLRFTKAVAIQVKKEAQTDKGKQLETALEKSLNKRYEKRLVNRPGDIPTNDQVIQDKVFLSRIPEITGVDEITSNGSDLVFVVTRRPIRVDLNFSAGGGYSTDQSVFGEAKGTLSNFFHIGETFSLQANAGRKITDCALLFNWYRQEPFKKQRDYTVDAKIGYYENRKQRFGNLFGPAFRDREPGGEGSFTFGFDSFTITDSIEDAQGASRKRIRYNLQAKTGFEYRDVRVTARGLGTLIARGQAAVFSLNLDQSLSWRIKNPHIDNLSLQVTASGWKGLSILSGDFPYEQFRITASPQIFFGFQNPTDMFFRYLRGIGASSRDTPIFKLFRFGGWQNVRGLEEGEIVGRNIAFEKWETGVRALTVWDWLRRKSKTAGKTGNSDSTPDDNKAIGGLDLSSVYVKLFYDRGRVLNESSLSELLDLAHGVRGYGIALEFKGFSINGKRASLTLGFARSPDSKLHPIGVITSGVTFEIK